MSARTPASRPPAASLIVIDPNGNQKTVHLDPLPFTIGRHADSHLILRDSRTSRAHARIQLQNGDYVLEDLNSRHGTFVNGARIKQHKLRDSDRIEFGFPDSYQLVFTQSGREATGVSEALRESPGGVNLARLRAVLDMARAVETSGSTQEVLVALVDTALAITGSQRGFLLLKSGTELEMRVARDRRGFSLGENDLRVPRSVIQRGLTRRRELLSMNFEEQDAELAGRTVADLDLRSVVCVPLVRVRTGGGEETSKLSVSGETAGVLYMDSRLGAADLSAGNRELLQALAVEASIILENARLLEEERIKNRIEEELQVAHAIQQSLLPRQLPDQGWFRACGSSIASHQVGGDYYDVFQIDDSSWDVVVADVCGKGVSSALLASLLQGAFLAASASESIPRVMGRINRFLGDRTEGEKYATLFYCRISSQGRLQYINAGHCPALLLTGGAVEALKATSVPVGLLAGATFSTQEVRLSPGDKLIVYTDGVSEARNGRGEFFGARQLREMAAALASEPCERVHEAIRAAVERFTESTPQADDITLVVLEYRGEEAG
jgi:phosphoserine phosphatase RsbU/P